MTGNFLTPTALWKDFVTDGAVSAETLKEVSVSDINYTHIRIDGRKTSDGAVGIYGVIVRKAQLKLAPAILIVQEFKDGADTALARYFAEKGYIALVIDLAGGADFNLEKTVEGVEKPFTLYPESLSYAVYNREAEDLAGIAGDVRATCWFEWGRVIRYAAEYLKGQPLVTGVGIIGIGAAATSCWQVISADCGLSAAVIVGNAGWKGYRGINKFGDTPEPHFGDDELKYMAGIEPQAYAAHVKCPLLLLSPTNSPHFDADRAFDTVLRVNSSLAKCFDYSVGGREAVDAGCFLNAEKFFETFLIKGKSDLPKEISVKSAFADGVLSIDVSPCEKGLKELAVYCAEEELSPALRSWQKVTDIVSQKDGVFRFEYRAGKTSGAVMFFARAGYDNGMHVSSAISFKKIPVVLGAVSYKHRVWYSSRMPDGDSGFYTAAENLNLPTGVNLDASDRVKLQSGPMDMTGLCSANGIITFKPNADKFKPTDGALIMMDAFVRDGETFTVKLIADYFGARTEYSVTVKAVKGVWQNLLFEQNRFKTEEGMVLKSFAKIQALELISDGEFVVNNLLWV